VVTIILEPSLPHYKSWRDLVLFTLHCYTLDYKVLSDVTDLFIYWDRLDSIMVTWILDILSPLNSTKSFENQWRPHVRRGSRSRLNSSATMSHVFCNSTPSFASLSKVTSASATTIIG
jgi:hypothetical protein